MMESWVHHTVGKERKLQCVSRIIKFSLSNLIFKIVRQKGR